MSHSI